MSNKLKKIFNINDCTIEELESILLFYKKRGRVNCNSEIEFLVNRLFLFCYKPSKLTSDYPQNNYCLLGLADITSKLARGSRNYNEETIEALYNYLDKLQRYYFKIYSRKEYLMPEAVYAVALLNRLVTLDTFDNKRFIDNLSQITDKVFDEKFSTLEIKDGIADETFNEDIRLIAQEPYVLTALDIFGIEVPRNDKVLDIYKTNIITTENKYLRKRKER